MAKARNPNDKVPGDKSTEEPKAGPSGATDKTIEREKKFDEEGGGQPQAASQHEADEALKELGIVPEPKED